MWYHALPWARVSALQCGRPPEGQCRRGAESGPPAQGGLRYCCRNLSLAFPQDWEARLTDFHGRIEEQFFFNLIF